MVKCKNWHGLPCLDYENENKKVVFTNIDGELLACEVDTNEYDEDSMYAEMQEMNGFDCLTHTMPVQDEFTLVLSLTERCNAACKYCFLDAQTHGNKMDEELLHAAIDFGNKVANGRKINVAAFGGEPSVAPELVYEMVAYAKQKIASEKKFSITTNGYFPDEFCDFLIDNRFHISLSMDGVPEVQRAQRPSGVSVEQLEKNIQRLAASECQVKVRCTVTEFSVDYMLDTVKYLGTLGVDRIHFEPVTPGGRAAVKSAYTSQPDVDRFVNQLFACIEYGKEHDMDILCFPYMNMLNAPVVFCDGNINNRLVVGAQGVLSTCVEVQTKEHMLYESLGLGSYDREQKKFVLDFSERRPFCRGCSNLVKNPECEKCAFKFFCAGGCPTRNYRGADSTEIISNYRCSIMKKVMPTILEQYYLETYAEE